MVKVLVDIPLTIPTGNAHFNIADPTLIRPKATNYTGPIAGYDFQFQKENYRLISERLKWVGRKLDYIYSSIFQPKGGVGRNYQGMRHSFVATGKDFVWQKFASDCAQAGQNHVYVRGEKWKTTDFVRLDYDQTVFLFGPRYIKRPQESRSPNREVDLDEIDSITLAEIKAI